MSKISIAGLQLEAGDGDNLGVMETEIDSVVRRFPWLDMVVLPELTAFGGSIEYAQHMPGPAEQRFCESARRNGVWLSAESMFGRSEGHIQNTSPGPAEWRCIRQKKTEFLRSLGELRPAMRQVILTELNECVTLLESPTAMPR